MCYGGITKFTVNKPILFKQCQGQIVYKDGITEPIFFIRSYEDGTCEVRAESGQYLFENYFIRHESGYVIPTYHFVRFNHTTLEYDYIMDNIKEFQIKENQNV